MCPLQVVKQEGLGPDQGSDCSIDEERNGSVVLSVPCLNENGVGFRQDFSAEGGSKEARDFLEKVRTSEVFVGDYGEKARVLERLAGGSFGEVYLGAMEEGSGKKVAIKVEPQGQKNNYLLQEGNIYRHLEGGPGVPQVYWFGYYNSLYSAMVMDLLGDTLEDVFTACQRRFSMSTVVKLAIQILDTLQFVHSKGYVHRDISPSNFVLGCQGDQDKVYLIDFGHAKKYKQSFQFVPRRNSVSPPRAIVGTPRFISVHAHLGHEDGPRDDLESFGYVLLYLLNSSLPWQGLRAKNMVEKLRLIGDKKVGIPIEKLCRGLPIEFTKFFTYVRALRLYEPIRYPELKAMFSQLADSKGYTRDSFDWEVPPSQRSDTAGISVVIPDRLISSSSSTSSGTPPSR